MQPTCEAHAAGGPVAAQDHFWRYCFRSEGRQQYFDENCPAPISQKEARAAVEALRANPETKTALNYWLGTVSVVRMTLETQVVEAERTSAVLDRYIGNESLLLNQERAGKR